MNEPVIPIRAALDEDRALASEVRALLDEDAGLSQAKIGRQVGASGSAISQWLAGKYEGDILGLEAKIRRWLRTRTARSALSAALPEPPAWVETPTARRVLNALSYAQLAGDVTVVYGGAGVGKTAALRRYAGEHPSVWVATITPAAGTLGACLERIAAAVGVRSPSARIARLEGEIVDRITDTRGLLLIDEAQHLQLRAIEAIRGLHDASGVGLALVGNEAIYTRITGGRRAAEFAQLFSRLGKRVHLPTAGQRDIDAIVAAWGISGSPEIALLREIGRGPGGLRVLTKVARLATLFAGQEPLSAEHVSAAWRDLGGDV